MHTNANTPIIIGAGQAVEHLRSDLNNASSAQTLASFAAKKAIQDTKISDLSEHIDVIAATRTFFDSVPLWPAPFGKSNNLPGSIAKLIGATPKHLVYASVGGQTPQSLINEWFEKLVKGQASVVLLAGAEVIASTNNALKAGATPDWSDTINAPFEDRELDIDDLVDEHLLQHLVMSMPINYGLCEMARLHQSGLSIDQYRLQMAKQLAPMSAIADGNQYAMFKGIHDATQLADLEGRNGYVALPYPKALVAKDAVNQAAATILTTVGKAQELGISEDKWVYLHGYAESKEKPLLSRANLAHSPALTSAYQAALNHAEVTADQLDFVDLYSCFSIVVSNVKQALGLADNKQSTLTGGLPFFGGPGNNYSMHGICELVSKLRINPASFGLIGANGGVMSKHAVGVYSCKPGWRLCDSSPLQTELDRADDVVVTKQPNGQATIESYTVHCDRGQPAFAIIIARLNADNSRFIANGHESDTELLTTLMANDCVGHEIEVESTDKGNRVSLVDATIHST